MGHKKGQQEGLELSQPVLYWVMFPVLWPVNYSHPAVQGGVKCCVITSPEPDTHANTHGRTQSVWVCVFECV